MISIKVQTVVAAAEKYMEDHLSRGEFVSEGEDSESKNLSDNAEILTKYYNDLPMRWQGSLVKKIGFNSSEPITKKQFKDLIENKNPFTGKNLTSRTVKGRRLYFDATTSAPKSVSILAITMGDHHLIRAHEEATSFVISEIEKYAQTRVRVNYQDTVRKTSSILCSSVTHTTSRANDPQLHSHNLIFNVTWDEIEQKFKALESFEIYSKANYFTEIYRHILAQKVQELGYQIEHQRHGWEIKGVSPEICEKFSKRSSQIKQIVSEMENDLGRKTTNKEKAIVTEKSRNLKSKNLNLEKAIKMQKDELSQEQLKSLDQVLKKAKLEKALNEKSSIKLVQNSHKKNSDFETNSDIEAFNFSINHIFERQSVVSREELISAAVKYHYGKFNISIVDKLIDSHSGLFRDENDKIGTIQGLAHELFISQFVDTTNNKFSGKKMNSTSIVSLFNPEQLSAFKNILASKSQVYFLEGAAGTGKSFLLSGVCQVIKENNIPLLAAAPTAAAAQLLASDLNAGTKTLQYILANHNGLKDQLTNGYLIVDEAGFISIAQMDQLFKITDKYNTQLLLVGDTRQHHGVEAGDALRSLKKYSNLQVSELMRIVRQKNVNYKKAVTDIQRKNFKTGWAQLVQMGCVHSMEDRLIGKNKETITLQDLSIKIDLEHLLKSYYEKKSQGKSVIVIAPTRTEVQKITEIIRARNPNLDSVQKMEKDVFASARFTEAEKLNLRSYVVNSVEPQFIVFHQKEGEFRNDSLWKIIQKSNRTVSIKNLKTDEIKEFNPRKISPKNFDILNKKVIELQIGDELILQKNSKLQNITNGEIVRVKSLTGKNLELSDGRIIGADYPFMDYGYVTTSYSSQGKTCDHVILAMTNAGGRAISSKQFYVSISRGRESIDIYVEDKEFIKSRIESFGDRTLNRELLLSSKSRSLNELKTKSLLELQEALQRMKLPTTGKRNKQKMPNELKKPWIVRQKEAFYKKAEKYMIKIKSIQTAALENFKISEKYRTNEHLLNKQNLESMDLDI